jgi:uncharacterized protein
MFQRKMTTELQKWSENPARKPLVLRGARQVGKTTAVQMFATRFETFIHLNLEQAADRAIFSGEASLSQVIDAMYFLKGIPRNPGHRTLIFIDEIQKSPEAVAMLRYFHEDAPGLFVIAAGSLLETMLDTRISFPVGRVEFLLLHPFSFEEFLTALGDEAALRALKTIPIPAYAHDKMTDLFRRYLLVGGMPEAVKAYAETGDLNALDRIHESLVIAYLEDAGKYAPTQRMALILRHVIQTVTATTLPLTPDTKKSPRLLALDTGMVVFKTGMRKSLFSATDVSAVFSGRIIEHVVGQELYAANSSPLHALNFWARDKTQSNAEVDYVLPVAGKSIPVEVKSGASGRLRSLHAFINAASHATAVRLYGGTYGVEESKTIDGKPFTLINFPWYQASMVEEYLEHAGLA